MEAQMLVPLTGKIHRRAFFQFAGITIVAATVSSCKEVVPEPSTPYINTDYTIDFKNDTGLLNYIYALEQLEAAFYTKAGENLTAGFTPNQVTFFTDIRLHEIAHREFFKTYLGTAAPGTLEFDFSSIDFSNTTAVLTAAKTIADLVLAAYNGIIGRGKETHTLIILSQIVSVEARHASWVREQTGANSFADLSDLAILGADTSNGFDISLLPDQVLAQTAKYIKTKLNVINLYI
ncbi:hypothetical protein TH53_22665 [Pedobacter lusitanus]|uniref:Contig116, whole genome shotgun sequence n=1 Tax=Pedobacter lusitanus TaxID=1503925 RepID=A0A0D0FRI5_9SPHI|nr:hypothetical protein TH53_22665 [Pedobacter lusitanus]